MRELCPWPSGFVVRGGRVIDPLNGIDRVDDVVVADGRIASIGGGVAPAACLSVGTGGQAVRGTRASAGAATIDAGGLIVCPGLVDMHVHLREPGGEHKETIESGTRAAAAGGFTSVACMPNTTPPIDNASLLKLIRDRAETVGSCRVHPIAAITAGRRGSELVDMAGLRSEGAVAFSDDGDGVQDDEVMGGALEGARRLDALVIQHCEFSALSAGGVMHQGAVSERLGVPGIDPAAEEAMIERDVALVRRTGARYHVAHVSTGRAVELVRAAKAEGLPVTTEVSPHHLVLSDQACSDRNPNTKMHPPLRSGRDVRACIEGLRDGTIDCIASDHAPHTAQEKAQGFCEAPFGIVGLETSLALAVKTLVAAGVMDWVELIRRMSAIPASILGITGGTLSPGRPADLTLIDPNVVWRINPSDFLSKSRNTPFGGWEVVGRPIATIAGGRLTHRLGSAEARFAMR